MTDVVLDRPREDAVELVRAVFEDGSTFASYTVEGDDERFVGTPGRGLASIGERVVVLVPKDQDGDSTTITVTADRTVSPSFGANPWKYKAEFLAGVRERRDQPVEDFSRRPERDGYRPIDSGHDGEPPEPPVEQPLQSTADAWLKTATVVAWMLLGVLGLVLVVVVVSVLFP